MSTKRQTRPPAGDNLEFIFPDPPAKTAAEAPLDEPDELEEPVAPEPVEPTLEARDAPEVDDEIELGDTDEVEEHEEKELDDADELEEHQLDAAAESDDDDAAETDDDADPIEFDAAETDDDADPMEFDAAEDDADTDPMELDAAEEDDDAIEIDEPDEADVAIEVSADGEDATDESPEIVTVAAEEEDGDTTAEAPARGATPSADETRPPVSAGPDLTLPEDESSEDDESADDWAHDLEALGAPQPLHAARVLHVEDTMTRSYGFGVIARSLLAIVALHALLALSIRVAPAYASAWLSRIPLAGSILAHEPTIMQSIELRNVAGNFQQLRNARRVFVITGEAVNRSPASIERIEVQGTLYGGDGRIDQKVVNAGNRTTLRDLSEKEIAMLQRLDPRRVVAPGESSTFLIVFLQPPGNVREFSSRVLNARPSRRLAQPSTTDPPTRRPDSVG